MSIRELTEKNFMIFDGAMGTLFAERHKNYGRPCELANIYNPDFIREIHEDYIKAGCNAIKTNTFQASPLNRLYSADRDLLDRVLKSGWDAAVIAAEGKAVEVFADIGPVPAGAQADAEEKAAAFRTLADRFLEYGARCFIFETNSSPEGLAEAASYIKSRQKEAYIIVSFAAGPDGFTRDGIHIEDIAEVMLACPDVDAFGLNCVSSALHMKALADRIISKVSDAGRQLCLLPNAGYPKVINDRVFYDSDPEYFGDQVFSMLQKGAAIAGGCCGTTPDHIRALRLAADKGLNSLKGRTDTHNSRKVPLPGRRDHPAPEAEDSNALAAKLRKGKKVIAVELDPPRNADSAKYMAGAWTLKAAGVDAITIADCATARASMDSSIMACKLRRELGIDALPHMTCRDRNLNATKALLMGLSTEGISNVLIVTGDPVPSAERDEVKSVFQFNSRMLASYISTLCRTGFLKPVKIYGALNINVKNFDRELDRMVKKTENGMSGFLTQPVLTPEAAENLRRTHEVLKPLGASLLGGIIPVVSSRNGRFMNSEISGINVDPKIIEMYEGKDRDQCTELAVDISTEIARRISGFVDGYYLMTPFSRTDIICRIVENIRNF